MTSPRSVSTKPTDLNEPLLGGSKKPDLAPEVSQTADKVDSHFRSTKDMICFWVGATLACGGVIGMLVIASLGLPAGLLIAAFVICVVGMVVSLRIVMNSPVTWRQAVASADQQLALLEKQCKGQVKARITALRKEIGELKKNPVPSDIEEGKKIIEALQEEVRKIKEASQPAAAVPLVRPRM